MRMTLLLVREVLGYRYPMLLTTVSSVSLLPFRGTPPKARSETNNPLSTCQSARGRTRRQHAEPLRIINAHSISAPRATLARATGKGGPPTTVSGGHELPSRPLEHRQLGAESVPQQGPIRYR